MRASLLSKTNVPDAGDYFPVFNKERMRLVEVLTGQKRVKDEWPLAIVDTLAPYVK